VAKGNPTGFLDSDDKAILDQIGRDERERRLKAMKKWEWQFVAQILLKCTVHFVESELVETEDDMKEYDLIIRILGEDGSVKGESVMKIVNVFAKLERQMEKFYQQQDDADEILMALDSTIACHKKQLV